MNSTPRVNIPSPPPFEANSVAPGADIASLTAEMARGDEAAYRRFYDLYFSRLLRYLLVVTRGEEEAAREALQITLLRVARSVRRFDDESRFWAWLAAIARHAAVDESRKHHRYLAFLDRFFIRARTDTTPDDGAEARLERALLQTLEELPWDERELVKRKYFARDRVRAIATDAGTTERGVESKLARIRQKLKNGVIAQLKHGPND